MVGSGADLSQSQENSSGGEDGGGEQQQQHGGEGWRGHTGRSGGGAAYLSRAVSEHTLQPHTRALHRAHCSHCTLPARGFLGSVPAAAAEPAEVQRCRYNRGWIEQSSWTTFVLISDP